MPTRPFAIFALFILLSACAPTLMPTATPEPLPTLTATVQPSPLPPTATPDLRVGGFLVLDGKIYAAADDGALVEQDLPNDLRVEKLSFSADNTLLALDKSGAEAARYESGGWVEVVNEKEFFSPENVEKMGSRFEVEGQQVIFVDPVSAEKIAVPMEISPDGATMTVMVNGEAKEFTPEQFVVFEPLKRGEDRMLVLEDEAGRVVWNEYSGEWIEDGWQTVTNITVEQINNFDALVWARLNGQEFSGATNTGKFGPVYQNSERPMVYFKKANNSTEVFHRGIADFNYVLEDGYPVSIKVVQILNKNGSYAYILLLNGHADFANDPDYFILNVGYDEYWLRRDTKYYGKDSIWARLLYTHKLLVSGQPSDWTKALIEQWWSTGNFPIEFEQEYYEMRDPRAGI